MAGTPPHFLDERATDALTLEGQSMVEYGMILGFVSVVAVVGLIWMGPYFQSFFSSVTVSV